MLYLCYFNYDQPNILEVRLEALYELVIACLWSPMLDFNAGECRFDGLAQVFMLPWEAATAVHSCVTTPTDDVKVDALKLDFTFGERSFWDINKVFVVTAMLQN